MPVWIQRAPSIIVTIGKTFKTHWSIYFSFQLPKRFLCIDLVKWRFHFRFKNATEVSTILSEICDLSLDKNVRQRRRLCRRLSHNKNNLLFQTTRLLSRPVTTSRYRQDVQQRSIYIYADQHTKFPRVINLLTFYHHEY